MVALLVAGSLITLSGCGSSKTSAKVATTANWNVRTSTIVEDNYFEYWTTHKEVADYSVSFTEGSNTRYSVSYDLDGAKYSTEFYMESAYDFGGAAIPEALRDAEAQSEPVYVYKTYFEISGEYSVPSGGKHAFSDVLVTESKFRAAKENLQPVYSLQIVKNTAPNQIGSANMSIDNAYVETDVKYETFYSRDGESAIIYETEKPETNTQAKTTELSLKNKQGYSVFDNSQMRAAMRAFTLTGGSSRVFNVVTPQNGAVQTCTATVSEPVELKKEDEKYASILAALEGAQPDDYIFFNGKGGETEKVIRYNAVSLSINASMAGASPTCMYATVENADVNATRCVMLRMNNPLSFGMGELTYDLSNLSVEEI